MISPSKWRAEFNVDEDWEPDTNLLTTGRLVPVRGVGQISFELKIFFEEDLVFHIKSKKPENPGDYQLFFRMVDNQDPLKVLLEDANRKEVIAMSDVNEPQYPTPEEDLESPDQSQESDEPEHDHPVRGE